MATLTLQPSDGLPGMTLSEHARDLGLHQSADPGTSNSPHSFHDLNDAGRGDPIRIPRIVIHAFCDNPEFSSTVEYAAADRRMSRAQISVHKGGIKAAVEHYQQATTPDLIIVESLSERDAFLDEIDHLSEVCYAGTKVMAIGSINDIAFYRELMRRGLSEYALAPLDPVALILSVSRIYTDKTSGKLGKVYAFIGAKGGVGSSTIAHNVGSVIGRKLSSNVVIADMDLPFGTVGLDFNLDAAQGVAEAIQDAGRLDEVLLDRLLVKCGEHVSLLSAPTALERAYDLNETAVSKLIEVAQSSVPFLILDMPHLWTTWARDTLVAADEIVITAAPDLANLRNIKNMLHVLRQARPHDPPPKIVLNQVGLPKRPEIKPAEFLKALQVSPAACILFDAGLFGTAANKGQMITDISGKGSAAKAIGEIADTLTGHQELKKRPKRKLDLRFLVSKFNRHSHASGHKVS